MQKLLKFLLILSAILLIAWVIAIDPVDYQPYWETDYYRATRARLDSSAQTVRSTNGALKVGWAKASITPQIGASITNAEAGIFQETPLAGYGKREGKPATGIHDSLFVKAIAFQVEKNTMVAISADMLIMPPNICEAVTKSVKESLGLKRGDLFFSATHTHGGVGAWSEKMVGEAFSGEPNQAVVDWLIKQISHAIEKALADLQPGRLGWGNFDASELVRNRLVGELGQEDGEFVFGIAEKATGQRAIWGIYGAHATTIDGDNMTFSADYPGYWYERLEDEAFDLAAFFAGGVGSHAPDMEGKNFEKAELLGKALADSVLKYQSNVELKDSLSLAKITVQMDLPEFHVRIMQSQRLAPFISKSLFPTIGNTHIQAARIGDMIWATAPADYSGESARIWKNELLRMGFKGTITSFNGGYVGYLIPAKYYHLNEYESRVMSWFGPGMGPYAEEMLRRVGEVVVEL